jgi:hypothetical protein
MIFHSLWLIFISAAGNSGSHWQNSIDERYFRVEIDAIFGRNVT